MQARSGTHWWKVGECCYKCRARIKFIWSWSTAKWCLPHTATLQIQALVIIWITDVSLHYVRFWVLCLVSLCVASCARGVWLMLRWVFYASTTPAVANVECNAVKSIGRPGKGVVMYDWLKRTWVIERNVVCNCADCLCQSSLKSVPKQKYQSGDVVVHTSTCSLLFATLRLSFSSLIYAQEIPAMKYSGDGCMPETWHHRQSAGGDSSLDA